jgi:hypothetical protein
MPVYLFECPKCKSRFEINLLVKYRNTSHYCGKCGFKLSRRFYPTAHRKVTKYGTKITPSGDIIRDRKNVE